MEDSLWSTPVPGGLPIAFKGAFSDLLDTVAMLIGSGTLDSAAFIGTERLPDLCSDETGCKNAVFGEFAALVLG